MGTFIRSYGLKLVCLVLIVTVRANESTILDYLLQQDTTTPSSNIVLHSVTSVPVFYNDGNSTTEEANTTTTTKPCNEPVVGDVYVTDIGVVSVNIAIEMEIYENICESTASINCTSADKWPWVIGQNYYTIELPSSNNKSFLLDGLSEFTTYTCIFNVTIGDDTNYINFTTGETAPTAPQNLTVDYLTSRNFTLTWELPLKYPTLVQGYTLVITRINASSENHFWNESCSDVSSDADFTAFTNQTQPPFSYTYLEALPDFTYSVEIFANSTAGKGNYTTLSEIITLPEASKIPESVNQTEVTTNISRNIYRNVTYSWSMPCNTNGPVTHFVLELEGTYMYDPDITDIRQANVTVTSSLQEYTFSDVFSASTYSINIYAIGEGENALQGESYKGNFSTADNYPSAPAIVDYSVTDNSINLTWSAPTNHPGNITNYEIQRTFVNLTWAKTEFCAIDNDYTFPEELSPTTLWFLFENLTSGARYDIILAASTSIGTGNDSALSLITEESKPQLYISVLIQNNTIDENEYNVTGSVTIIPGCFNGMFQSYTVSLNGTRSEYPQHEQTELVTDYTNVTYTFNLKPDYYYEIEVVVENAKLNSSVNEQFNTPAGVPTFDYSALATLELNSTTTAVTLTLKKEQFRNDQGEVRYLAVIVSSENVTGGTYEEWPDDTQWPVPVAEGNVLYYQASDMFWSPFTNSESVDFVIGQNDSCSTDDLFCNRPLTPGQTYYVIIRVFNSNFYRNSMPVRIDTDPLSKVSLIVGLTVGFFGLFLLGFIGFVLWRRGVLDKILKRKSSTLSPTEIPKDKLVEYCIYLEDNPDELTQQWKDLGAQSIEIYADLENRFALLPENKRKNRFTNILPFDHSRVKLSIDEDDEICSDYINASYIKGFSKKNEYIATQGPLPDTVRDFWKMVFQENVTMIVMVAKFFENKREKCYKYFPNNHESMLVGDDIEVRCSIELDFQIYCMRTLQVRKDLKQMTVTHMQFLEWPDFGIPDGTDNLLMFCHQFRTRWSQEGGTAVVHCSAGVGRTGTIIALDILTQALKAGKNIDVFKTVLELRRQRKSMVQTEQQYMYIYQLLRSIIEDPIVEDDENSEPLYQNIDLSSANVTNNNAIVESAL